jgi:hypothetical protein
MSCINQEDTALAAPAANTEFLRGMRNMWHKDYSDTAFLRDIPRLIKRTQVQTSNFEYHGPFAEEESKVGAIFSVLEVIAQDTNFDADKMSMLRNSISR